MIIVERYYFICVIYGFYVDVPSNFNKYISLSY